MQYKRTNWYGLMYIPQLEGSVILRCLPAIVIACCINYLCVEDYIPLKSDGVSALSHPYTFQLVGLVFGSLGLYRVNISYSRYWEGVTMVKNMHSKWSDACGQVVSFDRMTTTQTCLTNEPFCIHIVKLFSQMSAVATMRLHLEDASEHALFAVPPADEQGAESAKKLIKPLESRSATVSFRGKKGKNEPPESPTGLDALRKAADKRGKAALGAVGQFADMYEAEMAGHGKRKAKTKQEKIEQLSSSFTIAEREMLAAAPDPVFAVAQRIQRAILTRMHAGGLPAPPPIISRIFQEISNGLLAYNNATKMKEIAVPFAYVQLNAIFLNIFALILSPIAIANFTNTLWLSQIATALTIMSYYSIFIVANELEDPFGTEPNDMPMFEYHEEYCAMLCALVTKPWLPEDQWLVKSGNWVKPETVSTALNAFFSTIGSNQQVAHDATRRVVPHDSLLNRQKALHSKRSLLQRALDRMRKKRAPPGDKVLAKEGSTGKCNGNAAAAPTRTNPPAGSSSADSAAGINASAVPPEVSTGGAKKLGNVKWNMAAAAKVADAPPPAAADAVAAPVEATPPAPTPADAPPTAAAAEPPVAAAAPPTPTTLPPLDAPPAAPPADPPPSPPGSTLGSTRRRLPRTRRPTTAAAPAAAAVDYSC